MDGNHCCLFDGANEKIGAAEYKCCVDPIRSVPGDVDLEIPGETEELNALAGHEMGQHDDVGAPPAEVAEGVVPVVRHRRAVIRSDDEEVDRRTSGARRRRQRDQLLCRDAIDLALGPPHVADGTEDGQDAQTEEDENGAFQCSPAATRRARGGSRGDRGERVRGQWVHRGSVRRW